MRLLYITSGYLPYIFSETLCSGKLVYAMYKEGWQVDVISKVDEGPTYSCEWTEPWLPLRDHNIMIQYPLGGRVIRTADVLWSAFKMGTPPQGGIRWARRAYELALKMCRENHYDAVLTRSPSDIPHIVGLRLKEKLGIRWIANWNDPTPPLWVGPYKTVTESEKKRSMIFTEKCLRGADVNTFPSQSLLDHFTSFFPFLAEQQTAAIPHIALVEDLVPHLEQPLKWDKFRMCHSGNMSEGRDPDLTFRAMRELIDEGYSKMELSIMGHIKGFVAERIKKYHLEEHVNCVGSFPYMEAMKKMQEFDCLVLLESQLKKGIFFPSKFTDYAQLNKPILAISPTDGFAADTIAKYGGGISVDNEDYLSIKQGLLSLYKAWENHTLSQEYPSDRLYEMVSAKHVIELYRCLLSK